jgi:hypothetical protein
MSVEHCRNYVDKERAKRRENNVSDASPTTKSHTDRLLIEPAIPQCEAGD